MDHPHLDLVSLEDLQSELQQLGLDIEDETVLERMKNMCLLFSISCEKLVEAWYSYQLKRKIRGQPSIAHLDQFERNVLTKHYVKEHDLRPGENVTLTSVTLSSNDVGEDGMVTTDLEPKESVVLGEEQRPADERNEADQKDSPEEVTEMYVEVEEATPGLKQVLCYFGNSLEEDDWRRIDSCNINILPFDPDKVLDKNYKILDLHIQDFGDLMEDLIGQFQDEIIEKCPEIGTFTDLSIESVAAAYFCGRILKEIFGPRINSKSIMLEGPSKTRVRMDVEGLSDFSIFPGQIIAVKGINSGGSLKVLELIDSQVTLPPLTTSKLLFKKTMNVAIASGPFGDETNQTKLINYFKQHQPHIIILLGPFASCSDPDILDPESIPSTFANSFMEKILNVTNDSQIIVVPSPNDFFTYNIVPTTFSKPISLSDRVHEFSNPCLINVSGCVFAISTTDIILDLLREEYSKIGAGGERMKKLHEHVFLQKNFYPLFPPGQQVNIDYSQYQHLRMPIRPHILVMPSDSKHFCRCISGCICVNPGKVSKNSLARLKLEYPSDDFSGSIENLANIEIFKL